MIRLVFLTFILICLLLAIMLLFTYIPGNVLRRLKSSKISNPSPVSEINERRTPPTPRQIEPVRHGNNEEFSLWLDKELQQYEPKKPTKTLPTKSTLKETN